MRSRFGSYTKWLCARAPEIYAAFMGICASEFFSKTTKALLSGAVGRQKAKVERKALLAAAGPPPLVF